MAEYYQGPNNSAQIKAVTITLPIVASFLVAWRISWRARKRVIVLSDYLLVLGLCLSLCLAGFNLDPYFRWGYGYHKADLPPEIQNALTPKICFWLNQIFFKATAGVIKLSICTIYMSIFKDPVLLRTRIARNCNFALMCIIATYYTSGTLVSAFQCRPIQKAWLKDVEGECIDNNKFRVANAYINVITSALLVIMPYPVLLRTNRRKETWQFLGLIAIGLLFLDGSPLVQYDPQHPRHVRNLYRRYRCYDYDNATLFPGLFSRYSVDHHRCITFEDHYQSVHGD
ncbi:hypothetical protein HG530_013136 [Fusarium avenaceum]|nr:hypothetical protein HG530_013136 [Fusarium avenaceum]